MIVAKKGTLAKKQCLSVKKVQSASQKSSLLLDEIRNIIENSKASTAIAINSELIVLYWNIGNRISRDILHHNRAAYGKEILSALSARLVVEYGQGFSVPNLSRMLRFVECFPDFQILSTLSKELSWSHLVEIFPITDSLKREFYCEMCKSERWSVRTLRSKIGSMLYERTALSRKSGKLIKRELQQLRSDGVMSTSMVLRDPYILDFLDLKEEFSERDLENAILKEIEKFLLEIGTDFSFVARQKRLTIGNDDFYLDLLFYHRRLKRLVAIELKLGRFKAEYKGQMELYLKYLDKYERREGEEKPLGLILCHEKDNEQIQLLEMWKNSIHVAEYMTELPSIDILRKKLHEAAVAALEFKGDKKT